MLTRKARRRLRAARYQARKLSDCLGLIYTVKSDRMGFFYPMISGTDAKHTKHTSADLRTKQINQVIVSGRPKGKRRIRYTTVIKWGTKHPEMGRNTGSKK